MLRFINLILNSTLYYPEDASSSGPGPGVDAAIEFLKDDDEKEEVIDLKDNKKELKEPKKESKNESKKESKEDPEEDDDSEDDSEDEDEDDEDEDLKDLEEDLKEPDEEDLELPEPINRKDLLKKYPTIFKEFPGLEKAYYREQQFASIFPNPDDAKTAADNSEALANLEKDLSDGNSEKLFLSVKEEDPKGFAKLVDNFLPTLYKVDQNAYGNVIEYVIKHAVRQMIDEGRTQKVEALEMAAQVLYKFAFGSSKFEDHKPLASGQKENTEVDKVSAKENEILQKQFENHRETINSRVNGSLKATIEANIDPKGLMTPYIKNVATKQAYEEVVKLISRDSRFSRILDKLWERSFEADFNKASLDSIKKAFTSRAQTLLPSVIKKARVDGLKGMGKRTSEKIEEEDDDSDLTNDKNVKPKTHARQGKITRQTTKSVPKGMTSLEFMNLDD